jgi:hypothetical protein
MLFVILGVLAVLLVVGGVLDFRARRRGVRYGGVDGKAARDYQRDNETEVRLRGSDKNDGPGSWGSGLGG